MHRKSKKFIKIGLKSPTSENEVLSSLIISSASLLIENMHAQRFKSVILYLAAYLYWGAIKKALRILSIGLGAFLVERLFFPKNERKDQERSHCSETKNERLERVLKNMGTISNRTERELLEKNG